MRRFAALSVTLLVLLGSSAHAQARVGSDSATRLTRLGRDFVYGAVEGLGFAVLDQVRDVPTSWGSNLNGYGKRALSNVGEFAIQEVVTEGLAAAMNRPLDYKPCACRSTGARIGHALSGAVNDLMPDGSHPLAIPRIVGAYTGAYAQSTWRPDYVHARLRNTLMNGTSSLAVGALINLFYEFR